ncbi:MAG: hypothetical protein J2P21_09475 [Chloracidobacterium sp.]|nr:hypothetical protein [Chloracidobacterium sp.]
MSGPNAIVGVSDHGGWATLVTVAFDGTLVDRRKVELVDKGLPSIPHHHECQTLPIDEAVALVEKVRDSADRRAVLALDSIDTDLPARIVGIALRECPPLPATIAERITNYQARNVADWVMYRKALAGAAEARGWKVHWYNAKGVFDAARDVLQVDDLATLFKQIRRSIGPPWTKDHQLAMAAATVAAMARSS